MVLHNPNNWHWVNKDASGWAREWFESNLTTLEAKEGDVTAKISKIVSSDGDVDVSQRKGKVITIFDVKLVLEYSGTSPCRVDSKSHHCSVSQPAIHASIHPCPPCPLLGSFTEFFSRSAGSTPDEQDVSGTITVPEVAHDTEENEFVVRDMS